METRPTKHAEAERKRDEWASERARETGFPVWTFKRDMPVETFYPEAEYLSEPAFCAWCGGTCKCGDDDEA